jgi:hypothetical protein
MRMLTRKKNIDRGHKDAQRWVGRLTGQEKLKKKL